MSIPNKKTINIGIVCSPNLGGSGVVGSELAKFLAKKNKYKIVFIGDEFSFRLNREDVEFHKIEKLNHALFTHPLSESALTEGIVSAVIKYKLNIIHAHFAIPYAHCAIQAKEILRRMGINIFVVTTLHGTDVLSLGLEVPETMNHILNQSDAVTAVSMNLAVKSKEIYNVKKDIKVIYNFVDFKNTIKLKNPTRFRKKFAKKDEKIFIHISNFRPIKRVTDTLNVFMKAQQNIPSTLILVGEGPDIENAKRWAKTMKNEKSIHFLGKVKNPYKYLQIADGLIITSTYESFSLVSLEAMTFGVPVFGTKVGGIPELIENNKSGYLAEARHPNGVYKNIIQHFSDAKKITKIRNQAFKTSKNFSAEKIIPQYESIYSQLMLSLDYRSTIKVKSRLKGLNTITPQID